MGNLFNDPGVVVAIGFAIAGFIGAVTALVAAIAFLLRTNASIRANREERLTKIQETDNQIKLLEAKQELSEEQHRRDLELMRAQMDAEREQRARQAEQELEKRLVTLMEGRIAELDGRLARVRDQRDDLQQKTEQQQREIDDLRKRVDEQQRELTSERGFREDLENAMEKLRQELETVKQQKAAIASELAEALKENNLLRGRVAKMDQMSLDLEAMRTTVAEQQRQIRKLEEQANGHDEYDDDLPTPIEQGDYNAARAGGVPLPNRPSPRQQGGGI